MRLASRGLRDLDGGEERIENASELARVRAQARKVWTKAFLLAAVLTLALWLVPL